MRKITLLTLLLSSISFFAQVGIGTTTPNAALDIVSTNQGLLIPRVVLTGTNIAAPVLNPESGVLATSTLVYNSATNGVFPNNVFPGFYYWDGVKWVRLNTENSWLTNGNANTNPVNNFLGTIDNNDLVFKRNSILSGKLSTTNTSFGVEALSNTSVTAQRSVAIGVKALKSLTSGNDNVGVGYASLETNTTGLQNVAIGASSLSLNTSGSYNSAVGYNALTRNTTGIMNTAIGNGSLFNNLVGNSNVGIGKSALERNFSGSSNTAVGNFSLFNNQSGSENISIGKSALERNISGSYNIAIGASSLYNNQSTSNSTSVGHESQLNNLSGQNNTSLGFQSLFANSSGSNNIAIGYNSFYLGNYNNSIAIGSNTVVSSDNQVRIGNNNTTSIGGFTNWTNVSDKRFKKNINYKNVPGLDFILKLKPVTYNLDQDYIVQNLYKSSQKNNHATTLQTGFIAQEVEFVAKEISYDFSGIDSPKNENDYYGIRYAEFVVPLTKAIQEQQEIIIKQQVEIDNLKQEFQKVLAILETLKSSK